MTGEGEGEREQPADGTPFHLSLLTLTQSDIVSTRVKKEDQIRRLTFLLIITYTAARVGIVKLNNQKERNLIRTPHTEILKNATERRSTT